MYDLKIFLFIALVSYYSAKLNFLINFGRGHHEEHFCESIVNLNQWFRRCCLKTFLCAILVKGILGTILLNYFEFGPVVQEMSFKIISYLELLLSRFCSAEHNHLYNFSRGHHEEQFCEIVLNLDNWFRRRCCLKKFLI